jgi:hypothetical protein
MSRCEHMNFEATVGVYRLTDGRDGAPDPARVTGYMADVRVQCTECKRPFQFLGLEPGIDLQGARVSIDGLEAHMALCPQGEEPSALDRIAVYFPPASRQ